MDVAAYKSRVRNDNWSNFSVLRHGKFDGFLVTSKNSGTHWVKYMLAIALAETYNVPRPKYFSEDAVRPYIGWPKDTATFDELPRLAFSHTIPHRLMDWGWARNLAGVPPYVLCIRHPMSILASHYAKWAYDIQVDWETYLRGDPSGKRYRCDLFWLARFWNRWGEVMKRDPARFHVARYEETKLDPRSQLHLIAGHWNLSLSQNSIQEALLAGTKEAMAEKVDPDAEPNVLQNRKTDIRDLFNGAAMDIYQQMAGDLFRFDLGYDLLAFPD